MQNQNGSQPDHPYIRSNTHTRPRKSRTECRTEKCKIKAEVNQTSRVYSVTHILDHTSHARNAGLKKCKIKTEVNQTNRVYSVTHILGHAGHARNAGQKKCKIKAEVNQTIPCILSYTHTRPRKSRKECVIKKIRNWRTRLRN